MEELRRMREQAGLTQVDLAKASGVDRGTIIRVESGKRSPTIETLEKLARAMGAEIGDFFPKAQASLPLEYGMGEAWQRGVEEARKDLIEAGLFHSPYDALGVMLAERWRQSLQAFKESPGVQIGTLKAGDCRALSQFVWDVFESTAVYEVAAENAGYQQRPGYLAGLQEMHSVRQEAADTIRPILEYLKARRDTDAKFREIWEASDMDAMQSEVESL